MSPNFFADEGNIGSYELRHVSVDSEQRSVLNLSVRFDVRRPNAEGQWEDTNGFWAQVELWGTRAELLSPLLKVGARVVVLGSLSAESFESTRDGHEGETVPVTKIRAQSVSLSPLGIEAVQYKTKNNENQTATE